MVHTDLNPSNVLVRDGAVVAVVDIGNAGSGTRAKLLADVETALGRPDLAELVLKPDAVENPMIDLEAMPG